MTPEEIRETLFRTLDKLDELYGDRDSYERLMRKEREAHDLEVSGLKAEMASKERKLAEKERAIAESKSRIAVLEKELAENKAANVDARYKVESANQEKFCGTSKKGIDRKYQTDKGRDEHKDDFDGTSGSAGPQESTGSRMCRETEANSRSRRDNRGHHPIRGNA